MLLSALIIILQLHLSSAQSYFDCMTNPYGTTTNGRLIHDMRTFVNVTFDWNSPDADAVIPECHEKKIRMSYFEHTFDVTEDAMRGKIMRAGHLVYPLVIRVANGTASRRVYYAAAVHDIISKTGDLEGWKPFKQERRFQRLVIISESTWTLIWMRWKSAIKKGKDLCDGGRFFENILDRILSDAESKTHYEDIVKNYTDLTSDVCLGSSCDGPTENRETLMLAYPSAEGIEQIEQSSTCCRLALNKNGDSVGCIRYMSQSRFRNFMGDYYNRKEGRAINLDRALSSEEYLRATKCVFYPPFC